MCDFIQKNKPLIFPCFMFLTATILECPSLIISNYFSFIGTEYLISFILYCAFILLMWTLTCSESGVYLTTSAAVLMLGNWSQPLMWYACGDNEEANGEAAVLVHRIEIFSVIVIASVVVAWLAIDFIETLQNRPWIPTVICAVLCTGLCGMIFLFSDEDSNTSTVLNIQPAIIMCFLILYCFAAFLNNNNSKINRFVHLLCFAAMMLVLLYKHEGGIPLICYISCLLMYILLYPLSKVRFLLFCTVVPVVLVAVLFAVNHDLLVDTMGKITTRFSDNEQVSQAVANLKSSGLFGRFSYDYCLPQASTDFALNISIHFWGFIWAGIFVLLFVMGCQKKAHELSCPHGFTISTNLMSLSFTAFCVIIGYNLFVNLGIAPVVGVQALFSGRSFSIAILSGLLLGGITYDRDIIKKTVQKILSYYNPNKVYTNKSGI